MLPELPLQISYALRFSPQAGPIPPRLPTEGPTYQPLHGRRMTPNEAKPQDNILHTPGMRPLHHQSDTTYSLATFFHLMHIMYSLIMIDVQISTS